MIKRLLSSVLSRALSLIYVSAMLTALPAMGQESSWFRRNGVCTSLDVAFTVGTTGLGFELSTPVTKWASLRAGMDGIPKFNLPMHFDINTYTDGVVSDNFSKVQEMMYKMTGETIDENVTMNARPNMLNFKLLVDVFPFQNNRHWHFTAGFYLGSSTVGRALNADDETNSLVAMNIYNRFYNRLLHMDPVEDPFFGDIYLTPERYEEMVSYGWMGIHIGDFKDGTPYYMTPAPNGSVSAKAIANRFKPYLGFGYSGACDRQKRLNVGVEAGVLFWGGAPNVIIHDGVNMNKDLINVRGRVGDYLSLMKALVVYPVINFKISYTLK
jgi:hypothetical protein